MSADTPRHTPHARQLAQELFAIISGETRGALGVTRATALPVSRLLDGGLDLYLSDGERITIMPADRQHHGLVVQLHEHHLGRWNAYHRVLTDRENLDDDLLTLAGIDKG